MSTPFDRSTSSIPVTIVTSDAVRDEPPGVAVLRLEPTRHDHQPGEACVACSALTDIRAMLFDLLQEMRAGARPRIASVVVDAHRLKDASAVIARLDPHAQAVGLRDHTVARSFHLSRVI